MASNKPEKEKAAVGLTGHGFLETQCCRSSQNAGKQSPDVDFNVLCGLLYGLAVLN